MMTGAFDLTGRCGIVTGAASGIGRAAAVQLVEMGADVSLIDLNGPGLDEAAKQIENGGYARPHTQQADAADEDAVKKMVSDAISRLGHIDFLINGAGILRRSEFSELETSEWDLLLGVNLRGPFLFCKAVSGHMIERGSGVIVNIASLAGRSSSLLGGAHYTTAKHGLIGLSRHLARELTPKGIRVNAFCPGATLTPMIQDRTSREELDRVAASIPRGKIATVEEQARVIGFLVSDAAINITGACIDSNGGSLMV
jgi:3-oxoacyl-[acyl-carrier protein] reductase